MDRIQLASEIIKRFVPTRSLKNFPGDIDYFQERAVKVTDLTDFGDRHFLTGLEVLIKSITNELDLHEIGKITLDTLIINGLTNRLRFTELKKTSSSQLKPPIIITGLSRSGTTLLHRLLSIDPQHRSFPLWELMAPYSYKDKRLKIFDTELKIKVKNWLLPELDKKHYTRADTPEECILLMANSFDSQLFTDVAPVFSYQQWHLENNKEKIYKEYRQQLEILQSFYPNQRLVLKAPSHLGCIETLLKVIPEALIVQTYRDPLTCYRSLNSLRATLYKLVVKKINHKAIADSTLHLFKDQMKRNMEAFDKNSNRILLIPYFIFIKDPVKFVKSIYSHFKLEWYKELEMEIRNHLHDSGRKIAQGHKYESDDSLDSVAQKNFSEYSDYFESRF